MMSGELDPAYTKYSCGLQTPIWKVAESAKQDSVSFMTFFTSYELSTFFLSHFDLLFISNNTSMTPNDHIYHIIYDPKIVQMW